MARSRWAAMAVTPYTLDNTNPVVQQLAPGETLTETYNYTLTDKDGDYVERRP